MKKTKLIALFVAMMGLLLVSCTRDITEPLMSSNPTKPAASDLTLTVDFTKPNADSPITFSWSAADFGFAASITYTLQLSSHSDFSADVVNLYTTQQLTATSSVRQIDNVLLNWKQAAGTETTLYYRVSASVTSAMAIYSDVKSKKLTPFQFQLTPDQYTLLYMPGAYQGWSPGADNGKLYSYNADTKYESIIRITPTTSNNGEFKITSDPDWNHTNWGGTLTQSGANYSGTIDPSGPNFQVAPATYKVNVDVGAKTITLTWNHDWGIIGSSIPPYDWSKDVKMFYDGKYQVWTITGNFKAGEFKFRADNDWTLNYGDGGNGTLSSSNAPNLKLSADGNYTISFDPVALTYTVKKN